MTVRLAVAGMIVVFALAGCVSTSPDPVSSQEQPSEVPQRGLPAQNLEIGECGLFLWSVSGEPTFMFFSKATTSSGLILLGEEPEPLTQVSAAGDIFGQFMTEQVWRTSSTGQSIEVFLEAGEALLDGQRVSSGRLTVADAEGWETIIPVAGARACRSAPDTALAPPAP